MVRLLPQLTAASSATAAVASRKSRHLDLIIQFNLQLINLIAFIVILGLFVQLSKLLKI